MVGIPLLIVVAGIAGAVGYGVSLCLHRPSETGSLRKNSDGESTPAASEHFRLMAQRHEELEAELKRQNAELMVMVAERDTLVKEIHHRVKNNLQVIASLLRLQSGYIQDDAAKGMFRNSEDRVMSMALVHDQLYRAKKLSQIDFAAYVEELVPVLRKRYAGHAPQAEVSLELAPVSFSIEQAMPAALILNEILSNAFKYGIKPNCEGRITVGVQVHDGVCVVSVQDTGMGFSAHHEEKPPRTLGMRVVETLCRQLSATLTVTAEEGTRVAVSFPLRERQQAASQAA